MPEVVFILADGSRRTIEAAAGITLMEAAVQNQIPGIIALCGGACACATCHLYVDPTWWPKLPPPEDMEAGMLEAAWQPRGNSRLSCQVHVAAALDGLEVTVPLRQGT
jgi:2Fe-2S ferredoxin